MRVRHVVVLGASALAGFATASAGCGGGGSDGSPSDAGPDSAVTDGVADAPGDGALDAARDALVCVDASLLDLADGAAGGYFQGCIGCMTRSCGDQLRACDDECACKSRIVNFVDCVLGGDSLVSCSSGLIVGAPPSAEQLGYCVAASCIAACTPALDSGANDAAADAGSDGR